MPPSNSSRAISGLNEGHARRRGEGLVDFGSVDLGKCDQLRAVVIRTEGGGHSIIKERRKLFVSRLRALPGVPEVTGALAKRCSSNDDRSGRGQFRACSHKVEARPTTFFRVPKFDKRNRIHSVVNDVSDSRVKVEHLGQVEVADEDGVLHRPAKCLHSLVYLPQSLAISNIVSNQVPPATA